ncbi:MAG: M48 family metalloprotease [Candidatus Latescibacterota bacterium]
MSRHALLHPCCLAPSLLVAAALLGGCAISRDPITGERKAFGYTWAQEQELGRQADQQILQQYGAYEDADLQRYVEQLGQRVLAESHLRRPDTPAEFRSTPFTFRVLDSEIPNAFALPGGYVYVTRGLLAHLNNEAQLAVVLGHEVGHVAARHASERALKQSLGQLGLLGGAILGQEVLGGRTGEQILELGGAAAQLLFLRFSRDDEREADKLGVEYAARAHYQAGEAAAFFGSLDRLQHTQGGSIPPWMSTHPEPYSRQERIPELAGGWAATVEMNRVERDGYYEHLKGVVLGQNPRQGFVRDGVFYHPELRFRFDVPGGFALQNTPLQVLMVEANQRAILNFGFAGAKASAARGAAAAFAKQEGLQVLDSGAARVGRYPAAYVVADVLPQGGTPLRVLAYYLEYGGRVLAFVGYSARDAFAQFEAPFLATIRSFAELTDSHILAMQPARVQVVRTPRSAPFSAFVPQDLPRDQTPETLAILNQVGLDEVIGEGQPLKLPK